MNTAVAPTADTTRPGRARIALLVLLVVSFAGFCALGTWQVQRLAWKRDLVARVDARLAAAPAPAPARADWPAVSRERDEYRRVSLDGRWIDGHDTRTQAVTELGAGSWLLSPLRLRDGDVVLVNRGFVPKGAAPTPLPDGDVRVAGLLRISEPGGGFLRDNAPGEDRWYSRDVAAIAEARGLDAVAPYFVDAAADPSADWPRGGLTVVAFRNSHLSYALTWFGMAVLCVVCGVVVLRHGRRRAAA